MGLFMNRFRIKYKQTGKRRIEAIRKKELLDIFIIFKTTLLKNESMIKKYKVKIRREKHSKYLFRVIVTTVDKMIVKCEIIRKYGGKK